MNSWVVHQLVIEFHSQSFVPCFYEPSLSSYTCSTKGSSIIWCFVLSCMLFNVTEMAFLVFMYRYKLITQSPVLLHYQHACFKFNFVHCPRNGYCCLTHQIILIFLFNNNHHHHHHHRRRRRRRRRRQQQQLRLHVIHLFFSFTSEQVSKLTFNNFRQYTAHWLLTLVHVVISSRLDYCNSVLYGVS